MLSELIYYHNPQYADLMSFPHQETLHRTKIQPQETQSPQSFQDYDNTLKRGFPSVTNVVHWTITHQPAEIPSFASNATKRVIGPSLAVLQKTIDQLPNLKHPSSPILQLHNLTILNPFFFTLLLHQKPYCPSPCSLVQFRLQTDYAKQAFYR